MSDLTLAYLGFEVRQPARWRTFLVEILGCQPAERVDGHEAFRVDDAAYRLLLREGPADDVVTLGWADAGLRARAAKLTAQGVMMEQFSRGAATTGIRFRDPMGLVNEIVDILPQAEQPYDSTLMPGGFQTGAQGLGHAVLGTGRHTTAMERFYIDILGLKLTERIDTKIGPIKVDGAFLHCNPRHHSLALIAVPSRKKMLHFMLQANRLRDVGMALERAQKAGISINLSLGQHPDPDGTISFYGETPSGFDYEIGAGSHAIDPATHQAEIKYVTSDWGHKPSLRMKLRGAMDLLADKFSRKAA